MDQENTGTTPEEVTTAPAVDTATAPATDMPATDAPTTDAPATDAPAMDVTEEAAA